MLKVTDPLVLLSLVAAVLLFRVISCIVCGLILKRIVQVSSSEN